MKKFIKKLITFFKKCNCQTFHVHKHISVLECKDCGRIEFSNCR